MQEGPPAWRQLVAAGRWCQGRGRGGGRACRPPHCPTTTHLALGRKRAGNRGGAVKGLGPQPCSHGHACVPRSHAPHPGRQGANKRKGGGGSGCSVCGTTGCIGLLRGHLSGSDRMREQGRHDTPAGSVQRYSGTAAYGAGGGGAAASGVKAARTWAHMLYVQHAGRGRGGTRSHPVSPTPHPRVPCSLVFQKASDNSCRQQQAGMLSCA